MAHGGPSGTMWPDPSTLSSETSLNIPTPMMVARNEAGNSTLNHRQGLDAFCGSSSTTPLPVGGAKAVEAASSNGPTTIDSDADAVDPETIYGQLFADFVQSLDEFTPTVSPTSRVFVFALEVSFSLFRFQTPLRVIT